MRARVSLLLVAAWLLAAVLPASAAPAAPAELKAKLVPNLVHIGMFFGGTTVTLQGQVPAGCQVAVVLEGPRVESRFKIKERVLGFLWMNHGQVTFQQVPSVYLVYASEGLSLPQADRAGFGYHALQRQVRILPGAGEKPAFLWSEFVKLKEEQGLYHWQPQGVRLEPAEQGRRTFRAELTISSQMPVGDYQVWVLALREGKVVARHRELLHVRETGALQQLSNLAHNHGLLYGLLAVLVAIGAGLLMDLLFGTKKSVH
jgi:uncharacterized protein (TIGR02186 family)